MKEKQSLIEQHFLKLLEAHRFREITIKMICEEAHINRSTFYSYFLDKYDLLDRLIDHHLSALNEMSTQFLTGLEEQGDRHELSKAFLKDQFQYIYDNKVFFKTLMTVHPAQNFTQKFIQMLRVNYLRMIENQNIQYAEYFVNYTLGGQFGIIFFWLQNDCPESSEEVADIVYRNILKTNR
ncbi:TetR/AcrR family transcriptional regulator [Macrococcus carouselicus]|uniref:TetR/AcrR family transcriptional regulator n=1 Tax=Macrococcus carouselicus TaxID=69969 RepID=A0A9Q8CL00_9STAP|nr:TetR/AcrR family transcriptional regulator [Macrococcus carouselicus]TDM03598.1 TetR/AcrR family transcriptional regulator [Macrococcus carouselicus]